MASIFETGINGLADTKWSGIKGACAKLVGIDYRSKPGVFTAHQKLTKNSGSTVDELTKVAIPVSDGSTLWFSSTSGKIWRENAGVWTLVHTVNALTDFVEPTPIMRTRFSAAVIGYYIGAILNPSGSALPELIASAASTGSGSSTTISVSIDVPTGYSNLCLIMIAGNHGNISVSSITVDGGATTAVGSGGANSGGWDIDWMHRRLIAPSTGTRTVTATFGSATTNRFIQAFVFAGVNQASPVTGNCSDFDGASTPGATEIVPDGTDLQGTAQYQMRYWLVASQEATHTQGENQTLIVEDAISSSGGTQSSAYRPFDPGASIVLGAQEFNGSVYYATENILFSIPVEDLASWSGNIETAGEFSNGNATYHPMVVQNLQLFVADGNLIAKVNELSQFIQQTELNVEVDEVITTLIGFDIDILIGTKDVNTCRVLRWDTVSESWSAEDQIDDTEVYAFIRDDNFVYAVVGDAGRMYFYDGEKLVPYLRLPGSWTPSGRAKVNANAVGFLLGIPVFGVSSIEGNPTELGVYGLGSYSKDYPKTLSLDFPISTDVFADVEIGAIITKGSNMWVSWKSGASPTYGVDKLDYTAKYASAYLETMMLTPIANRSNYKTVARVQAPYASLPSNTNITLGYKKKYEVAFTSLSAVNDTQLCKIKAEKSIPKIASLQLRLGLTVSGNTAPEVEDLQMDMVAERTQPVP